MRRKWTDPDLRYLRKHYGTLPVARIAKRLRRTESSVYQRAKLLGLVKPNVPRSVVVKAVKQFNPRGYSDTEIAAIVKCERHRVGNIRKSLGLPDNTSSERRRRRVAEKTRAQCEAAGVASLAEVRAQAFRKYADRSGWPADLRPRHVHILNALYDHGPMTRREIADTIGMTWRGSRKSLHSSDPEGSYLDHLARRGFVQAIVRGRQVTGRGKGRSCNLYMIPLTITRGEPATWPKEKDGALQRKRRTSRQSRQCKTNSAKRSSTASKSKTSRTSSKAS